MTAERKTLIFKLLVVFAVAFSLASIAGPMSNNFHLPGLRLAHGYADCGAHLTHCDVCIGTYCANFWIPGGPAMDTETAVIFTDESAEFSNLQSSSPSIDFTDWPLPPNLISSFATSSNFAITSSISEAGYSEIQFMLANNFWGCNFNFGNSTCGVNIRQGIAHMIDTVKFAANESGAVAGEFVALDSPSPSDNIGGLQPVNPCGWDSMFQETNTNCASPPPGGLAYHLGTASGAGGFSWNQAAGSWDMDAAAAHFVAAGLATGCDGGTGASSCATSSGPVSTDSRLTGISSSAISNSVNIFIEKSDRVRLDLGNSLSEQICYLFTGSYTTPCGYLTVNCDGGLCPVFAGTTTSSTGVNLSWGMYTAAYASPTGATPFDRSLYFQYNSRFVSGVPSIITPTGSCSPSAVPSANAADYMYLCDPVYDSLTNQMEFASSILSAVSFAEQAEGRFGGHAYTLPIFERNAQFGYLGGWQHDINNAGTGAPNYFTWLDAWNPTPAVSGTLRQGFRQTTSSVSPFILNNQWNQYVAGNIYDSLAVENPESQGQLIYWMALSVQQLPNSQLTYTPPANTIQSFRVTLRGDMFFQDGRKVTSFDVAFSYLALKGTGALAGEAASPMTGVTILGPSQFDINVNAIGPFTLLTLTGLPILPGAYWSNAGSSTWTNAINTCTSTGASCYPAQYTINPATPMTTDCALTCLFPPADINVNSAQTSASYDPISSHSLVGSGPWECGPVTSSGSSASCSTSGTENPPVSGSYILTRFGKGLAPASNISSIYFRSNGNLALYLWSEPGDLAHDFLTLSIVAACFGTTSSTCSHWMMGIGGCGGTTTSPCAIGVEQVSIVNRFAGVNWVAPFNWNSSPPTGVIPLNPLLYENTIPLPPQGATIPDPTGPAGSTYIVSCTIPYQGTNPSARTGGYDC